MAVKQTAGHDQLGGFAPEFAHLNDDILFGEVWSREDELSLRDRSLVTVVALMSQGLTDSSFKYHLESAKNNGITKTEIAEILTHAAFYAGWPKAWAAFRMAKEVWCEDDAAEAGAAKDGEAGATVANAADAKDVANAADAADGIEAYAKTIMFPVGQPNADYAQYFVGNSWLAPVSTEQVPFFNVTFEPGCRNNWHVHHATEGGGQMLVCVGGRGWYQEWGKPAVQMHPGDVVHIPANTKHWHGAAADSWFSHLAFEISGTDASNEWLEPVDDAQYSVLE